MRRTALPATVLLATLGITAIAPSADAVVSRQAAPTAAGHADPRVPAGFAERQAHVNGITVNYVRGGHGQTLVLLHGYPESWYEWRGIMPALAEHYTVIAPDLRGAGGSSAPEGGYDKKTMAADLHGLLTKLGLDHHINLVGHDIGTMVAYSYAVQHQDRVAKLVLSEAPIPDKSIYNFPALTPQGPGVWNFGFFSVLNGLPEQIIEGRERLWVKKFISLIAVHKDRAADPAAIREYAGNLRDDRKLKASFEWFRALNQDVADNKGFARHKLRMPVLALGADHSLGRFVPDQVKQYAKNVKGDVITDSGHWIYEEHPEEMTRKLLDFLA
ncbi:alpha/beta fold hydrolase [Planotetraspora sp. A-T 1434]|uniref:alpha/beta fold hydrolase n=1 Tax=Planotetraspora sp. A-T 1434 TaxID=2979219 RepID=UPI0021C19316|nr:alpha/beta fold hydrolase [Planotetraspora sp. A-T 1434]MCT9935326.1 alpha/beta fold hydrolase [Planotetraspora sp. A-T 1434]